MEEMLKRPFSAGDETSFKIILKKSKLPPHTTTTAITAEDYFENEDEYVNEVHAEWSMDGDKTFQELRKLVEEPQFPSPESEVVDVESEKPYDCSVLQRVPSEPLPQPAAVTLISDPYSSLSQPLVISSSYITINGNEESCGSSFSDSDCSVMASVDMATFNLHTLNLLNSSCTSTTAHQSQSQTSYLGISGGDTEMGYIEEPAGEMMHGWMMEEVNSYGFEEDGSQVNVSGLLGMNKEAPSGWLVENGNQSVGINRAYEYDGLAWDDEALARFIGEGGQEDQCL